MSEADRIAASCTDCGACVDECVFLKAACRSPRELAARYAAGDYGREGLEPYLCNLCGLCQQLCPESLNIGSMCQEARRLIAAGGHTPARLLKSVKDDRQWLAENFALTLADSSTGKCDRAFFPGCVLSGYSPQLVMATYRYLLEKLPGTGIMLGCCGYPTYCIGPGYEFTTTIQSLKSSLDALGASQIIAACPQCHRVFKDIASLPVKSLYEVMVECGPPEVSSSAKGTFCLHDSCPARNDERLQGAVRHLVNRWGHRIIELENSRDKTRCCGMGGMVGHADLRQANKVVRQWSEQAKHDMLSYCASCREAFAFYGKPSLHVLDLMFNPDWEKDKRRPAKTRKQLRESQSWLRQQLMAMMKLR